MKASLLRNHRILGVVIRFFALRFVVEKSGYSWRSPVRVTTWQRIQRTNNVTRNREFSIFCQNGDDEWSVI